MIGAISKILIANAQLAGSLAQIFKQETWGWVWQSNGTQFLIFISGAVLALAAGLMTSMLFKKMAAVLALILLSAGFAASGHTQGAENMPFLPLWIIPHILIAGFWIWAPISLWPGKAVTDSDVLEITDRFSLFAVWAVPFLFVTGLYLLWRLNGNVSNIWATLYGRLLLGKLAAALMILGVGAVNKFRIAGQLRQSPEKGRAALRKSLSAEAALFAVVIICVLVATTITGPGGHHH